MQYRIILYDRATEEADGLISIPRKHLGRVLGIAGVSDPNEPGELPLGEDQVGEIAKLIGFAADLSRFHYHLEPIAPALAHASA
jgi:hypothetical protein